MNQAYQHSKDGDNNKDNDIREPSCAMLAWGLCGILKRVAEDLGRGRLCHERDCSVWEEVKLECAAFMTLSSFSKDRLMFLLHLQHLS